MDMGAILLAYGINFTSAAVYDFIKSRFALTTQVDTPLMESELKSFLNTENSEAIKQIIGYLIETGELKKDDKTIFAGSINLKASNTRSAMGAQVLTPTIFKPGSTINVTADNVDTVTGLKIG